MEELTQERLEQALAVVKKIQLPAQPKLLIEISRELEKESPDFRKITTLVTQDAAMSAKVLNVINSPFFGAGRKVDSIGQALNIMGLNNFHKIVITSCLREAIGASTAANKAFWNHSLRTALAAERIAKTVSSLLMTEDVTADMAYMAGLFHDTAAPLLLKKNAAYQPVINLALSHQKGIIESEDRLAGSDHCVVAHLMARSWALSQPICKAILHHHDDAGIKNGDAVPLGLLATLKLADFIAYTYEYSIGNVDTIVDHEWSVDDWCESNPAILAALELEPDAVEETKTDLFDFFGQAAN